MQRVRIPLPTGPGPTLPPSGRSEIPSSPRGSSRTEREKVKAAQRPSGAAAAGRGPVPLCYHCPRDVRATPPIRHGVRRRSAWPSPPSTSPLHNTVTEILRQRRIGRRRRRRCAMIFFLQTKRMTSVLPLAKFRFFPQRLRFWTIFLGDIYVIKCAETYIAHHLRQVLGKRYIIIPFSREFLTHFRVNT